MTTRTVSRAHRSNHPDPIALRAGDTVKVGEVYQDDPDWPGWVWCTHARTGKSGWVPVQLIDRDGDAGTALEAFTAFELDVSPGQRVTVHRALNGWSWVEDDAGRQGWVPDRCLTEAG